VIPYIHRAGATEDRESDPFQEDDEWSYNGESGVLCNDTTDFCVNIGEDGQGSESFTTPGGNEYTYHPRSGSLCMQGGICVNVN
jgi:hypothetical protein